MLDSIGANCSDCYSNTSLASLCPPSVNPVVGKHDVGWKRRPGLGQVSVDVVEPLAADVGKPKLPGLDQVAEGAVVHTESPSGHAPGAAGELRGHAASCRFDRFPRGSSFAGLSEDCLEI